MSLYFIVKSVMEWVGIGKVVTFPEYGGNAKACKLLQNGYFLGTFHAWCRWEMPGLKGEKVLQNK